MDLSCLAAQEANSALERPSFQLNLSKPVWEDNSAAVRLNSHQWSRVGISAPRRRSSHKMFRLNQERPSSLSLRALVDSSLRERADYSLRDNSAPQRPRQPSAFKTLKSK